MLNGVFPVRYRFACLTVAWLLSCGLQAARAEMVDPARLLNQTLRDVVSQLQVSGQLMARRPQLAQELIEQSVLPLVDFRAVARSALGRYWRQATPRQQAYFSAGLEDWLGTRLTRAMLRYSDDIVRWTRDVRTLPVRWSSDGRRAMVRLRFRVKPGVEPEIGFSMRRIVHKPGWQIEDVTVLGFSMVAGFRQRLAEDIGRHGLEPVLARWATGLRPVVK